MFFDKINEYKYQIGFSFIIVLLLLIKYYTKDNNNNIKENIKDNNIFIDHNNDKNIVTNKDFTKLIKTLENQIIRSTKLIIESSKLNKEIDFKNKLFSKDIIKKNILIDSFSSINDINNYTTSNYTINFGTDEYTEVYKNVIGFRLIKATLPNMIHTVTLNNNRIDFNYNNNQDHIILDPGDYNFTELGDLLVNKLNVKLTTANFTITKNTTSFKYILNWESGNFNFLWKTSFNDYNSPSYLLFGDNPHDYTDMSSSHIFPHIINQTKHYVDLVIPEIPNIACKLTSKGKQVIDRIPLTSSSGSLVYYRSPEGELQTSNYFYPMKLSSLNIQLYENDSNKLYDSQNGHNYFEFEITIVENTKYFK